MPVYLVIDDTLNPKRGKRMAWVGKYRSSAHGKPTTGHCMVSAMLVIGNWTVPLAFALYKKKKACLDAGIPFHSQVSLAGRMMEQYQALPNTQVYVLADRWYSANDMFKMIARRKGFEMLTAWKKNRKLYYAQEQDAQAQEYAQTLLDKAFNPVTVEGRCYQLHRLKAQLSSGTSGTLVISRCMVAGKQVTFYLCSTDQTLTPKPMLEIYRIRWEIETFYKNAKQLLGLSEYQVGREQAILRHWLIVFIAASLLEVQRYEQSQTLLTEDPTASKPTLGEVKRQYGKLAHRLFVAAVFGCCQNGLALDQVYRKFSL